MPITPQEAANLSALVNQKIEDEKNLHEARICLSKSAEELRLYIQSLIGGK